MVKWLTPTISVKIFNSIGFFGMSLGYCLLCIPGLGPLAAFALLTYTTTILGNNWMKTTQYREVFPGAHSAGLFKSIVLISRDFSSLLMSFVQLITCLVLLGCPFVVGALVPNETVEEWRRAFLVNAAIVAVSNVIFLFFGSGEVQLWALDEGKDIKEKDDSKDTPKFSLKVDKVIQ